MKLIYPYLSKEELLEWLPEIERFKVSVVARSPNQFVDQYINNVILPEFWVKKRHNFIKRTLASYIKNPTYRRYLSLIAWAYMPRRLH
jgi:hypothetical protein